MEEPLSKFTSMLLPTSVDNRDVVTKFSNFGPKPHESVQKMHCERISDLFLLCGESLPHLR